MALSETRQLDLVLRLKDKASSELKSFGSKIENLEPAFQKMAIGGAAALGGIAIGVKKTVDEAVFLGESINAVNVVFKEGADDILEFGKNAARSVGLASGEFNQLATSTGALLGDVGKPMEEVSEMTIMLAKRAADLASVYNTDVDQAMSAINQAIRGETEAIRAYASDVTDASLQQFALSKGIKKSVSEMTFQEKKLLRIEKIMADTAVTEGDFLNTSDSLANQQRILTSEFKNLSAEIGSSFIPIIQDIITQITPVLNNISQWIKDNPELTKNIIIATAAIAAFVAVIGGIGLILPAIITGVGALTTVVGGLFSIMTTFAAGLFSPIGIIAALTILATVAIVKAIDAWGELRVAQEDAKRSLMETNEQVDIARERLGKLNDVANEVNLKNAIDQYDKLANEAERLANLGLLGSIKEGFVSTIDTAVGKYMGVNDAIISPKGDIITTDPKDYLIATKNPSELTNSGGGNVNVNIMGGFYLDRNAADKIAESVELSLRRKIRI